MVHLNAGAAAGVDGVVQRVQKRPGPARACRGCNTEQLVVSSGVEALAERKEIGG